MAELSSDDLESIIDELTETWRRGANDQSTGLSDWRTRTHQQVATIMSLGAHVHMTAMLLRPALPDELTIAHMPLVRAILETTVTLAWCDEVADGTDALINEGGRQRRNLRRSLADTHSMKEMADQIKTQSSDLPTSSAQQAREIKARFSEVALDGGYAMYRMLSSLSHVSIDTIDAYLDDDSLKPGGSLSVKSNPGPISSSHSWAHLVACCLLWSARVVDYLDPAKTRRNRLRQIAYELGIPAELAVFYSAQQRGSRRRPSTR